MYCGKCGSAHTASQQSCPACGQTAGMQFLKDAVDAAERKRFDESSAGSASSGFYSPHSTWSSALPAITPVLSTPPAMPSPTNRVAPISPYGTGPSLPA